MIGIEVNYETLVRHRHLLAQYEVHERDGFYDVIVPPGEVSRLLARVHAGTETWHQTLELARARIEAPGFLLSDRRRS